MSRARRIVATCTVALVMLGCTQPPDISRSTTPVATSAEASSETGDTSVDLAARKRAAGIADCPASDPQIAAVEDGLPDLALECLGGGTRTRLAGLRGRPMLVNVWAQWCEPCRQEAPFLSEIATVSTGDLMVLGIDFNDPRPELAIEFADLASWRYPQLVDPDKAISAPLQLANIPQTLLVDADGRVVYRHAGPFTSADAIRQVVQQRLGVTI